MYPIEYVLKNCLKKKTFVSFICKWYTSVYDCNSVQKQQKHGKDKLEQKWHRLVKRSANKRKPLFVQRFHKEYGQFDYGVFKIVFHSES